MIPLREEIVEWLKAFIADVKKHEIAVNAAKTTGAVIGVFSTIALFTPAAPLGVTGSAVAGVTAIAATTADFIANKLQGDHLSERAESMKEDDLKLCELMKKFKQDAKLVQKVTEM